MSAEPRADELSVERYATIAAEVDVNKARPLAEVLSPFGLSVGMWEAAVAEWTKRLVNEIKERSGSGLPIEERYPIATAYATTYAKAVKEARRAKADAAAPKPPPETEPSLEEASDDEATMRIPPGRPKDEPFSVLAASNRAARRS